MDQQYRTPQQQEDFDNPELYNRVPTINNVLLNQPTEKQDALGENTNYYLVEIPTRQIVDEHLAATLNASERLWPSQDEARAFLIRAGILTESGEFRFNY